jgi:hypothetical protein
MLYQKDDSTARMSVWSVIANQGLSVPAKCQELLPAEYFVSNTITNDLGDL